jgi:hypothetical protein
VVFAGLRARSEIIMVSLFGLTYAAVRGGTIANAMAFRGLAVVLQHEIDAIKTAVIPGFVAITDGVPRTEIEKALSKLNQPLWFEVGGLAVITLICLFELFDGLGR